MYALFHVRHLISLSKAVLVSNAAAQMAGRICAV
jgi:hypothetical protein